MQSQSGVLGIKTWKVYLEELSSAHSTYTVRQGDVSELIIQEV